VASNPVVRYVADALRFYMEFHARYDGFYGAFIHDPLAVAAALDRSLVTTEALYVDVETRGEITSGMTVADRRRLTGKPPNLDVAVTANVAEFLDRLVERVGGLAADHPNMSR
jgi:purine nucleosidase